MRALVAGARGEAVDSDAGDRARSARRCSPTALDPAFKAEAILLPSESLIADRMDVVDPDAIHASREALRAAIGSALDDDCSPRIAATALRGDDLSPQRQGHPAAAHGRARPARRRPTSAQAAALAKAQFDAADNMTDRQGALGILVSLDAPERQAALDAFYERFHDDALVLDKWFALQAAAQRPDTRRPGAEARRRIPTSRSPTRTGCARWPACSPPTTGRSTRADGRGYAFLADMILAADKLNPQIAARLVPPFGRWRRFEPKRAEMMRAGARADRRDARASKDVFEQATKSLA